MSDCKSCDGEIADNTDPVTPTSGGGGGSIVSTVPVTVNCPVPVKTVTQLCSTIKDNCGCLPPVINPLAKITSNIAFAIPACGQTVDVTFVEDVSGLMAGLEIYGVDPLQHTIRLLISAVTPSNKLTLKNICSSCCSSTKPVGEAVLSGTTFSWGIPICCSAGSISPSTDCLVGTFFFPAIGATSPANVPNANNFALGGIYSLGGFLWEVVSRVTSTQILLRNPSPGNGSSVGGFIEGGESGECIYPLTPVSGTDPCNDAAVTSVTVLGCTVAGEKKLTGSIDCGVLTFNKADGSVSVKAPFNGSTSSGPHYIEYDSANPCNSKLVYSPELSGAACATTKCSIYLTPANVSNLYEVEVSTTAPFTTIAPNNIVTISSRQFTVVAIVTAGTPGKIRIQPRFPVTVSETIAEGVSVCVVEGCQPFPSTDWPYGCDIVAQGQKVYCSNDGLRGSPAAPSLVDSVDFTDASDVNIQNLGTYTRATETIDIVNPSSCRTALISGTIASTFRLRIDTDGTWVVENLLDFDVPPTTIFPSIQVQSPDAEKTFDVQIITPFAVTVAAGGTKQLRYAPQVQTLNASATPGLLWGGIITRIVYHLTTS